MKLKFFDLKDEEDEELEIKRLRLRFQKKRGELAKWYELFEDMRETVFDDMLLAPRLHQEADQLTTDEESPNE